MSEKPYQVQNTRVYGQGQSYNCLNKITAEQLCNTLNQYHTTQGIIQQYDKINKDYVLLLNRVIGAVDNIGL
jgi:hypothetical protein